MKKQFRKIVSMLFMMILFVTTVAGCGEKAVATIKIKEGTLEYVYKEDTPVSFDDLRLIVTYNDGSIKEVGRNELTISEFSTENIGTYQVTITYEGKSVVANLKVTNNEDELYGIFGVDLPESVVLRNETYIQEQANYEVQFYNYGENAAMYVVGDDNPFKFLPKITALNDNDKKITIEKFKSVVEVYYKNSDTNNEYTKLEGDALAAYVVIDDVNQTYDFAEEAIGDIVKLVVRPYWLDEVQLLSVADYTVSIEFKVVDGYNIHEENELAVLNDVTSDVWYDEWDSFISLNGIQRPVNTTASPWRGIVLHRDLELTKDNIPAEMLDSNGLIYDEMEGNKTDIYYHRVKRDETFTVYGNYFTINASKMPLANVDTYEKEYDKVSRTTLFQFSLEDNRYNAQKSFTTFANFENIALVGNTNREDTETGFGGLIAFKITYMSSNFNNVNIRKFYINAYANCEGSVLNLNKVKAYDAYQNNIFSHGGEVNVTTSTLQRSGGPAMLLRHVEPKATDGGYYAVVNISADTVMDSPVMGNEAWFTKLGVEGTVGKVKAFGSAFEGKAVSLLDSTGKFNSIGVNMSDGLDLTSTQAGINGVVNIAGKEVINFADPLVQLILNFSGGKAPIFRSSNGGYATVLDESVGLQVITSQLLLGLIKQKYQTASDQVAMQYLQAGLGLDAEELTLLLENLTEDNFFSGDYLALYYLNMGLSFKYYQQ